MIESFLIFLIAYIEFVYLCTTKYTYPNFPYPRRFNYIKSYILGPLRVFYFYNILEVSELHVGEFTWFNFSRLLEENEAIILLELFGYYILLTILGVNVLI